MKRIQALFVKLVALVEENPTPIQRYFGLFLALLAVRLCLEFFSSHRLFTTADILHIGLWFVFIVSAFLLQLHLFSGQSVIRITKLVVVGFSIALTAPIIDLILHGGVGAKMNYLSISSWQDAVFSYLTIGGASLSRGATLGIRIEIVMLVIASFNYVRIKRNSLLWGLGAAVSIYTVLFISGTIPKFLGWLVGTLQLSYEPDDQSTLLLLLTIDLILLGIILWRYNPAGFSTLLRKGANWRRLPALWMFIWGARLGIQHYPEGWKLNPTTLFWGPILILLAVVWMGMVGLQNWCGQAPVFSHGNQRKRIFLILLALGLGFALGERAVFLVGVLIALQMLLYEPPLHLAKFPLTLNLLESMLLSGFAIFGFVVFGGPMVGFPHGALLTVLLVQMVATSYPLLFWRPFHSTEASTWKVFPLGFHPLNGLIGYLRILNQIAIGGAMVTGALLLGDGWVQWLGVAAGILTLPLLWIGLPQLVWILVQIAYIALVIGG